MSSEQTQGPATPAQPLESLQVGPRPRECRKPMALVIGLAIVGAAITWGVLKVFYPPIVFPEKHGFKVGMFPPPEMVEWSKAIRHRMAIVNPVFALGLFGAILNGAVSIAWLGRRRTKAAGLLAAAIAAVVGGGFGCLAGYSGYKIDGMPVFADSTTELAKTITLHVVMLMTVGAGVGLGVGGVMIRTWRATGRGLAAGVAGGFLAGLLYTTLAALLFPGIRSDAVIPNNPERTLWIGLVSLLLGMMVSAFVQTEEAAGE